MFRNPKNKPETMTRESPQDFMLAFLAFKKREPEHQNLTPKGYALLREARSAQAQHTKRNQKGGAR